MKKIFALGFITFLSLSCEKTIDYEIPREEAKISLDARLITGERISALVGHSHYVLDAGYPELLDSAQVLLYEDDVVLDTLHRAVDFPGYTSDLVPTAGKTYRVHVSHAGYEPVSGHVITPERIDIASAVFDSLRNELTIMFQDPSGVDNFYRIRVLMKNRLNEYQVYLNTSDPFVDFFYSYNDDLAGDNLKYGADAFTSDNQLDGQMRKIKFEDLDMYGNPNDTLLVELLHLSEDFYKHERSKGAWYTSGDNPFGEPVQVYSNVENGYGIVAGASRSLKLVKMQ